MPTSGRVDQKNMVHLHNGIYAAERKKELLPFVIAWMELESIMLSETKPGGERQIPYDLTYKLNLINKTN